VRRLLALGLVGAVAGGVAYYLLTRRRVVEVSAPRAGAEARVEIVGPAPPSPRAEQPRVVEVAPGRYVAESPFRVGQEVVVRTPEGRELRGRVVQVGPVTPPPTAYERERRKQISPQPPPTRVSPAQPPAALPPERRRPEVVPAPPTRAMPPPAMPPERRRPEVVPAPPTRAMPPPAMPPERRRPEVVPAPPARAVGAGPPEMVREVM